MLMIILLALFSLVLNTNRTEAYDPLQPIFTIPENLGIPTEIPGVEKKTYDFRQTFSFPGDFGGYDGDEYAANFAYISPGTENIITLVNGRGDASQKASVWYKQKLNLNTEFEFSYYTFVGQNNVFPLGIGDGMTLTFHNDPAGINAIGGYGGGIGVYPISQNQPNMIYNAVTVEMDTYENVAGASPNYDGKLVSPSGIIWPHAAISSTKTKSSKDFSVNSVNDAYVNNTHYVPTFPTSRAQANSEWFSTWVKTRVKWVPSEDGVHGTLSYEINDYGEQSQVLDIDAYWNSNYNSTTNARWDRKVVWGFTSSNHSSQRGNPVAILMDELPYEPQLDVERKVKNITEKDLDYKETTIAKANPGDILEYKVKVINKTNDDWGIPFVGISHKENLETNTYVANSLSAKITKSGVTSSFSMTENVTTENILQTSLGVTSLSKNGDSYEYTYRVKVGTDTTKFENDLLLSNTYGPTSVHGKTIVDIIPQNLSITKKNSVANPKVGDTTKITLETQVENGRLVIDSIEDSIPAGFEVIPKSTYFYEKGTTETRVYLPDSVWNNNNLIIDGSNTLLNGGSIDQNAFIVEYMIKPIATAKGKEYTLPTAEIKGHNEFVNAVNNNTYTANSNNLSIKIQTDVIISFKYKSDGSLVSKNKIISSDTAFNNTNPVVIYMNTGDSYDYTNLIKEISENLLANDKLNQREVLGDVASDGILESGSIIDILYTEEVSMVISQVYKENNSVGIYDDLVNQTKIDNSKIFSVKQGDEIEDILSTLIAKNEFALNHPGYEELLLKDYQIIVNGNPIATDVVPSQDFIVRFEYTGFVTFETKPDIDFGKTKVNSGSQQTYSPTNSETEVKIMNTTLTESWELYLSLPDGFEGDSGDDYLGEIFYVDDSEKKSVIDKSSIMIEQQTAAGLIQSIDMKGSSSKKGLLINQQIGNRAEKFKGKLLWSLEDTPVD